MSCALTLSEYEPAQALDPKRLAAIDTEIKRLTSHIKALVAQVKDTDRPALVEERNTQLNADADRIAALTNERAELSVTIERSAARAAERADLAARIRRRRGKLDTVTPAQQMQALDAIGLRVKLLSRSELSKCIKLLISSEIAPPDELTL